MTSPLPAARRAHYTIVLELTTTAPLSHGAGTAGNEQVLRTSECVVPVYGDAGEIIDHERVSLPVVSGSAFKAALREQAVFDQLELLGVEPGTVSLDALRLLLKGGKNDSGGQSMSLERVRELRELFPLLSVFGAMDGGMPLKGAIEVSQVTPYTVAAVESGRIPKQVRPLHVNDSSAPAIEVFPGVPPLEDALIRTTETYYRHDPRQSSATRYIEPAQVAALEDKSQARKALPGAAAKKEVRREANESMPHSMQVIASGVPMFAEIRLNGVTDVEFTAFARALDRWIRLGAHLGGCASKGHGACRVLVRGALRHEPGGALPTLAATAIAPENISDALNAEFIAHLNANATRAREKLAEVTR